MIRTGTRNAMLLAAATLAAGTAAVNCSSKKTTSDIGDIALELTLPSGQELTSVNFEISNAMNQVVRSGAIDVSGKNSRPAVLLTGLAPGRYQALMTGRTTDTTANCRGTSPFDVVLAQTTQVTILMQCRQDGTTGSAQVNGDFNTCPVIDSYVVTPLATDVGKTIDLRSMAHDPDCTTRSGPDCTAYETTTSVWTATAGSIAPASGGNATYTCTAPGQHTLTLTVSDLNADRTPKCPVTATVTVTCVSDSCGNNVHEPALGEQCDGTATPAGQTCDANCRIVPRCGNGIREGAEQCDPPNMGATGPNTCNAMCQGVAIECGNTLLQPGEGCDPPAPGSCSATCQPLVARCGDGIVNTPPGGVLEGCDLGPQNGVAGSGCSATCTVVQTCGQCEAAGATNPTSANACNAAISGCTMIADAADRALCESLVSCIRSSRCANDADGDATPCYCGTASDDDCFGGLANGMCKMQVEAAAKSANAITIGTRAADPAFPVGRVFNLMKCDIRAGCGPAPVGRGICSL